VCKKIAGEFLHGTGVRVNEGPAVRLLAAGHEIRTVQALLLRGQAHVETTMIYTHVIVVRISTAEESVPS